MRKKKSKRRKIQSTRPFRVALFALACVATIILIISLCVMIVRVISRPAELGEDKAEESQQPQQVEVTEGLTEEWFLTQRDGSVPESGVVNFTKEQANLMQKWEKMADASINYQMTIIEEETYHVGGVAALETTQRREIDVYSTESEDGQYYLIKVEERDFQHSSRMAMMPGIYFFKADGSTPIQTMNGEIPEDQKQATLKLLMSYTLNQYCNPESFAGRMGELTAKAHTDNSILFSNENAELEIFAQENQIQKLSATYTQAEGTEIYHISVEVSYGKTFDVDQVDILRDTPTYTGNVDEIKFLEGSSEETVSLSDMTKANEIWDNTVIPEVFSIQATHQANTTVVLNQSTEVREHSIVCVETMLVDGELYTQIIVQYLKREGLIENKVAAGAYIFNDEYIWTDRGVLAIKDAPNLHLELMAFNTTEYLNPKWQLGNCGQLYLESLYMSETTVINLIEDGSKKSVFPNYARVDIDENGVVTELQTHIRLKTEEREASEFDLEISIESYPEEGFNLPS